MNPDELSPEQRVLAERSRLIFVGGTSPGTRAWAGPWPPPDALYAVKGKMTGTWVIVEQDRFDQFISELGGYGQAAERFVFERYFRQDTSTISDGQIQQMDSVIRAAEYVPEPG